MFKTPLVLSNRKKSLWTGSILIILIVFSPYLIYFYTNVPDVESIDTIFGTIKGGHYQTVQIYLYTFFNKFIPLFLLILWFITNKHWWVHALIIPISVYLFQLINVVNDSEQFVDEIEFIYTIPFTVAVLIILYYLRTKLAIYIQAVDLKKEMDQDMEKPIKIKRKKL